MKTISGQASIVRRIVSILENEQCTLAECDEILEAAILSAVKIAAEPKDDTSPAMPYERIQPPDGYYKMSPLSYKALEIVETKDFTPENVHFLECAVGKLMAFEDVNFASIRECWNAKYALKDETEPKDDVTPVLLYEGMEQD